MKTIKKIRPLYSSHLYGKGKRIDHEPARLPQRYGRKYSPLLKGLRQHLEMHSGLPMVKRSIVLSFLSPKQIRRFEKKYKWYKIHKVRCTCKECGALHYNEKKFIRYAYFWNLDDILSYVPSASINALGSKQGTARVSNQG